MHPNRRSNRYRECQEPRGRARVAKHIHSGHTDVDGIVYTSRLAGEDVYAVFDRSIGKLVSKETGLLEGHPELTDILKRYGIGLVA